VEGGLGGGGLKPVSVRGFRGGAGKEEEKGEEEAGPTSTPMMGTWLTSGSWLAVVVTSSFLVDVL